jgi:hypothetical protein
MGGNPDSDEFDEDEEDEAGPEEEELDLDRAIKDMEIAKRRSSKGGGSPAWRRLEQRLEQKRTADLISDFEDYDLEESEDSDSGQNGKTPSAR